MVVNGERKVLRSHGSAVRFAADKAQVAVVGGGLAGCEIAWALARRGIACVLFEMKPVRFSPAHRSQDLAELVCSNSLRSTDLNSAIGLLKAEMTELNSLVMDAARSAAVPAGKALAVDRLLFSEIITSRLKAEPLIRIERREITGLDDPVLDGFFRVILASGPLSSESLTRSLEEAVGGSGLYFYDAIAPIVVTDSIDMTTAFWASRYDPDTPDYLNCPMDEEQYLRLVRELKHGDQVSVRDFEDVVHFEGCLPVEVMAERGDKTLAFGPLKPVGLMDPGTGKMPYAVVQLRPENKEKTALNMVGFQTRLKYGEQKRIFRCIPGMEHAEFERLGSMHRNTFVDSPRVLGESLQLLDRRRFHLAGQITGVEGYLESAAVGLWLGLFLDPESGVCLDKPPRTTALGALLGHVCQREQPFQPSNVHFGLMPALGVKVKKAKRKELYAQRARKDFSTWLEQSAALPS